MSGVAVTSLAAQQVVTMGSEGMIAPLVAGPTTAIMLVQIAVALAETWFLAELGTASLAGSALVVPFITMMHNMAAGGVGGVFVVVAFMLAGATGGVWKAKGDA